jgi:hypothetical protein
VHPVSPFRLPDARRFWEFVLFLGLFFIGLGCFSTYMTYDLPQTTHAASLAGGLFFWLIGAIPAVIGVRGIRAMVAIEPDGVLVRNTLRTHCFAVEDVEGFEVTPAPGTDPQVPADAVLRLRKGRSIRLSAFRDEGLATSGAASRRYRDVADQVEAMNERLAAVRVPGWTQAPTAA